jgi:hypothetical protein
MYIMLSKFIDWNIFIIAFAVGMFFVYTMDTQKKVIVIQPSLDNQDKFQFKDGAQNCFQYHAREVKCPSNISELGTIQAQMKDDEDV